MTLYPSQDSEAPSKNTQSAGVSILQEANEIRRLAAKKSWRGRSLEHAAPKLSATVSSLASKISQGIEKSMTIEQKLSFFDNLTTIANDLKSADHLSKTQEAKSVISTIDTIKKALNIDEPISIRKYNTLEELRLCLESYVTNGCKTKPVRKAICDAIVELLLENKAILTPKFDPKKGQDNAKSILDVLKILEPVDANYYNEGVALWISLVRIPIKKLELSEKEMLDLAPHLLYLHIDDGEEIDGSLRNCTFTEEFIGKLLNNTNNLQELVIQNSDLKGSSLDLIKNTDPLGKLHIINCPNFNHPLPKNLPCLQDLMLAINPSFNQLFPENLPKLQALTIVLCNSFNRPLPTHLNELAHLLITFCENFNAFRHSLQTALTFAKFSPLTTVRHHWYTLKDEEQKKIVDQLNLAEQVKQLTIPAKVCDLVFEKLGIQAERGLSAHGRASLLACVKTRK